MDVGFQAEGDYFYLSINNSVENRMPRVTFSIRVHGVLSAAINRFMFNALCFFWFMCNMSLRQFYENGIIKKEYKSDL